MKKILILFTSLLLVVTCTITNVKTIHGEDKHIIDGHEYSAWTNTGSMPVTTPGYYYLTNDVTIKWQAKFDTAGEFHIDLNGHNFKMYNDTNTDQRLIFVSKAGANVYIENSSTTKSILTTNQPAANFLSVASGAFLSFDNVEVSGVSGNTVDFLNVSGTFEMHNSSVKGNTIGCSMFNSGGTLKVYDTEILNNTLTNNKNMFNIWGGTVAIQRTVISNNSGYRIVNSSKQVTIEDSEISSNNVTNDGIIYIGGEILTVKNTSIINNTAPQAIKTGDSAQTYIKGSTVISGNKNSSNVAKNLYAKKSATNIHYDDLTNGASIYIDHPDATSNYVKVGVSNMNTDKQLAFNYIHATGDDTFYGFNDKGNVQLRFVNCSGISLNKANIKFDTLDDDPVQLEVTYNPTNTHDKSITWTSSDEEVATVVDGLVTPIGFGTATITAKQNSQSKSATCTVTISEPVPSHDHENGDKFETPWGNNDSEWTKLPTTAGTYYLTHDIEVASQQFLNQNVSICLNGYSITNNYSGDTASDRRVMRVGNGAIVKIDNCKSTGIMSQGESLKGRADNFIIIGDNKSSKLVLNNITISGVQADNVICVDSAGGGNVLELNNVNITGNNASKSLIKNKCTVNFNSGTISNNTILENSDKPGAAITNDSGATLNLVDGIITGNTSGNDAGGILNATGVTTNISGNAQVYGNTGKVGTTTNNIKLCEGTTTINGLGANANIHFGFSDGSPVTISTDSEGNLTYLTLENDNYDMSYEQGKIVFIQNKVIKEDVKVNTDLNSDGTIQMNFATKVKPELEVDYDTAYVEVNGVKTSLSDLKYTVNDDGSRTYETPAPVMNPRQMTDKISMVMYDESGNGISEPIEMTVQDYLGVLAKTEGDYKEFAKSMLNYGSYTQLYFGYNPSNLANSILDESDRSLDGITGNEEDAEEKSGTTEGATIFGTSLNLKSTTEFNVYFTIDGNINEFSVTVDDNDGELVASETQPGKYYVKISGVAAPDLGDVHTIVIKHNAEGNLTFKGSVLSYAYKVIDRYSETKVELSNCMKAMYKYSEEAGYLVEE